MPRSIGDYGSHYPVLAAAVARTEGTVLELGCGDWSTPMLHLMCMGRRKLVSCESEYGWMEPFLNLATPLHQFVHVTDWTTTWVLEEGERGPWWDVAFVDHSPGEARASSVRRLRRNAHFVVVHDTETDYGTGANYKYEDAFATYKYRADWRRYRPYTTVLSDFEPFDLPECDRTWKP